MWRLVLLSYALTAFSCDPIDQIRVQFPVEPTVTINARWVMSYQGTTYAGGQIYKGEWTGPLFDQTRTECCGLAHDYRRGKLHFIACVQRAGLDPILVCGKPGDDPAKLVRNRLREGTCDVLDKQLDVEIASCTVAVRPQR